MSAPRFKQESAGSTRQRLIDAARAEFSEKGIDAATTRGIAERAGCNEVTLFRHFESKAKLLAEVVQETACEIHAICALVEESCGDLRKDLHQAAVLYNAGLERCEGMMRALIAEGIRRPTLAKELVGDVLGPLHEKLARCLEFQRREGRVRSDARPREFAELFTATLMGGMLRRTAGLSALDGETWVEETVELFVRAVEAR